MKIQCDVCGLEEASVFCSADEAALCEPCDARVHHANKLANKHLRFTLTHPSPSSSKESSPLCDICKERRALLFCQQDRALLCRECDSPVHNANLHTQKHIRFLLTGVKLSASSTTFQTSSSSSSSHASSTVSNTVGSSARISTKSERNINDPAVDFRPTSDVSNNYNWASESTSNQEGCFSVSATNDNSISEYLTETLPGWHVGDFLDPSSCSPFGFPETHEQSIQSFMHEEFHNNYGYY